MNEESSSFREAKSPTVQTESEPIERTISTDTDKVYEGDELPINLYREDGRPPYFLEFIDDGKFAHKTLNVKFLSESIDEYLLSEGLEKDSYREAFDKLIEKSGAEGDVYSKIDTIHEYVRIQNKLLRALEEKKAFEAKSTDEMSSEELERYING